MRMLGLVAVLLTLVGARDASPPPAVVNVVAVHATQENRAQRDVDPALDRVHSSIADITEFDTFRATVDQTVTAPFATDTPIVLTPKHKIVITPLGTGPRGQVRFSLIIQQPPKAGQDRPVNALSTTVLMPPNKPFRLRGLRWQGGELVVIVTLKG